MNLSCWPLSRRSSDAEPADLAMSVVELSEQDRKPTPARLNGCGSMATPGPVSIAPVKPAETSRDLSPCHGGDSSRFDAHEILLEDDRCRDKGAGTRLEQVTK